MLRADEVLDAKFTQTQFAEGYDEREVDGLLDAVVTALRHHESGSGADGVLTSAAVRGATFTPTRMRRGYAAADVDALLERAADALAAHEGAGGEAAEPAPARVDAGGPGPERVPAAGGSREGVGARLLRLLRGETGR
ncbi:DivIVA domain-containing protein [Phycicoccus avicenniae]|uniref:DivIVA domain-containing protein n=1 Tax=Phycicoccus avicenniae TaxID=2828860 RepID=UPI003D29C04F